MMLNNKLKGKVIVIGGGISGLGSSYYLKQRGIANVVLEQSSQVGGRAGFVKNEDHNFETGGKNFSQSWSLATKILSELGINEFEPQHGSFNMLLNGKILSISSRTSFSNLFFLLKEFGLRSFIQLGRLMTFVKKNRYALHYASNLIDSLEKKDAVPITKLFAQPLAFSFLRMFSIIMGAAEPDETYYSNLLLMLKERGPHFSIKGGIVRIYQALEKQLNIEYHTKCDLIEIKDGKVVGICITGPFGSEYIPTSQVIVALPAHLLPFLIDLPDKIQQLIGKIRYFPLTLINAVYKENIFSENRGSLMFSSDYHLGHCSANRHNRLNSIRFTLSGRKAREIMNDSDECLIALAEREFSSVLPIKSSRLTYHVQRHPGGICAYAQKYSRIRKEILEYVSSIQGLEIAGDYLEGHNMEGCLNSAYQAAERTYLSIHKGVSA